MDYNRLEQCGIMDNLRIQSIIPSSISDISYVNLESQCAISISHQRHYQKTFDYQIKINGPESKQPESYSKLPSIQPIIQASIPQSIQQLVEQPIPRTVQPQTEHNNKETGYYLNKDTFSEEEIFKAFNIIDINKDNVITEDDLVFVLDYIKEEFNMEEVKEMIMMLSADRNCVTFEEFKRLGRGDIVPLAKYNVMATNLPDKAEILDNLDKAELLAQDPNFLIECFQKDTISYNKFEQMKKASKISNPNIKPESSTKDKLFLTIPIKSPSEFKQRKQHFLSAVVTNIEDLIQNYQQYKQKEINMQKIASLLQISIKQAKELYPNSSQVDSGLVIMQAIVYSGVNLSKKVELCLEMANSRNWVSVVELVHILQVIKGRDDSIENKIKAIVNAKHIKQPISKSLAYELVLEYSNKLMGVL